jgi:hypothetical protein
MSPQTQKRCSAILSNVRQWIERWPFGHLLLCVLDWSCGCCGIVVRESWVWYMLSQGVGTVCGIVESSVIVEWSVTTQVFMTLRAVSPHIA